MADEPREILLFANPIAGKGRGQVIARQLETALGRLGYAVRSYLQPAKLIAAEKLRDAKPYAAISIGGDGTLRGVTERLLELFDDATLPPIAVIPLGTANLMGKHLGLRWKRAKTEQIVGAIQRRNVRRIDAARANGRLFLLMAGVGIDGQVVHELDVLRSGPIGYVSYVLPIALTTLRYKYPPISVFIDGELKFGPQPGIAFVGNVAEYGTGFPLLTHARSDDGLLDVCVLPCASRLDAVQLLFRVAIGRHMFVRDAVYANAKHVRIEAEVDVPAQVDGDAAGHTPLDIELLDRRVPFIVE